MGGLTRMLSSPMTGSVAGGIGDLVEGFAGGKAADFQAQIARNNAQIARFNAAGATQAGEQAAFSSMLRTRDIVGRTKAAQAASGIDVNSGSAVSVQASERMFGMLDALTIRSNAARAAYGYQAEAGNEIARSKMLKQRGKMARISGLMDASGTILEGASSVDRQRRIWQDTIGDLEEDDDTMPSFGPRGDFATRFA
jgi:hypothetical protein